MSMNKAFKEVIMMTKRLLFVLGAIVVLLLSSCDPVNTNDDKNPDDSTRESMYADIEVNNSLPLEFEMGLSAEDWTTYFTITDEDDGSVEVTNDMLGWDPAYDYNEVGFYTLTCTYTNSLGNTSIESIQIEVIDGETPQEGTVGVEIYDNYLISQFVIDSPEPDWTEYFSVYDQGIAIDVTSDMITFAPVIDMGTEGEYTLTIDYIDDLNEQHTLSKAIFITDDSQSVDIEPMTIYEILYQTNAFDTVRIDGLEVISVYNQKFIGALNEEYILITNYGTQDTSIIESLQPGDLINVVGTIQKSNGFSLSLELVFDTIERISINNDLNTGTATFIELNDVFDISYLEFLTSLRETVASYDGYQLGGLTVINDIDFEEDIDYLVEFVMVNHYEGYSPEIFVISYQIYEDDETQTPVQTYVPTWTYDDGDVVSITVETVSTNGIDIMIGYVNDTTSSVANIVIIDTNQTAFDWLVPSLVEGGRVAMTAEVIRTENNSDGYGFILKPISDVFVNAADPIYFGKTYGIGSINVTTASEYTSDLEYNINFLGIMPIGDQGYVYEMTATYDSSSNTIGGLTVSPLGAQLNTDGEYSIQFVVKSYYEDAPYAEIIILNPYYQAPIVYTLNNEIGSLRNLIVSTNNGVDLITATNIEGTIAFSIQVPLSQSSILTELDEGDTINIVGQITTDGYTDTSIEIVAIQIEEIS